MKSRESKSWEFETVIEPAEYQKTELDIVIGRIKQMEQYMDEVFEMLKNYPESIKENKMIKLKIRELENYQESGQWLLDYECDERGELPSNLKRGVLSEDMLYNLLCDVKLGK